MNNNISDLDTNQMIHKTLDAKQEAQRVTIVGQELSIDSSMVADAIREGLKSTIIDMGKTEKETVLQIERIEIPVPIITSETRIERIEVPVVIKEIEIVTIEKPVIVTEIKIVEVNRPIVTKEIQIVEVVKPSDKIVKALLVLNVIMLLIQFIKR